MVDVPPAVLLSFTERRTYIAQGEALAPILALWFHAEVFRNADVTAFIDNFGVLAALTAGRSRVMDFASLLLVWELLLARVGASCWLEHVDSGANPPVGGSRIGVTDTLAARLGVQLVQRDCPPWPREVLAFPPALWLEFL